jgi:hypothetical protein
MSAEDVSDLCYWVGGFYYIVEKFVWFICFLLHSFNGFLNWKSNDPVLLLNRTLQ